MTNSGTTGLADANDEILRAAVARADIPALLPALAAATGDLALIPPKLKPQITASMDPTFGLSPDQIEHGRDLGFRALQALRDHPPTSTFPSRETLTAILSWAAGGVDMAPYLDLAREELAMGEDLRRPAWNKETIAPDRSFRVVIVGAGMSGIVAAHRLRQAGVEVVVVEKNSEVGGTWLENTYPGCRVDVSNLFYSYSFAQRDDWPEFFSSQQVLLDYFRGVVDSHGLRSLIRFDTEVVAMAYDDDTVTWRVDVVAADGTPETIEAHAVVTAVGQLNRPAYPDIAGRETFAGASFHSARWDHSIDLTDKRVAIIGTGASGAQFIPVVGERAGHLTVFQRTPGWFIPSPQYTDRIAPEIQWLRRSVPGYTHWSRFLTFWRAVEGMRPMAIVDPDWDDGELSVSAANQRMREFLTRYLETEFADRPDLLPQVIPRYAPFSKRFILDNGAWARTLKRDTVSLVSERIAEIAAEGVRTADGTLHEVDAIIYGTGFAASDFLTPMKVTGRRGQDLHNTWGGDARAYLGITLPGFPNFFMLYGPNTNLVVNGSIIYFSECQTNYIVGCIEQILANDIRAIDPRREVHDSYNARIDEANLTMAWGVSTVSSWYKNATGRTAQNWPFSLLDYWRQTRRPELGDYHLI